MWEKNVSPAWLLVENNFAFFYSVQTVFFFFFVSRPWAFYVVGKHVIFICFFFHLVVLNDTM